MAEPASSSSHPEPLPEVVAGVSAMPLSPLTRLERAVYRMLIRFLARRFAWEAAVDREPASPFRTYAQLLTRIDADMAARDPAFLRDHPMPRRGHLRIVK